MLPATGRARTQAFARSALFSVQRPGLISVTSKSRYAVVALAELARSGSGPVPLAQIAERRAVPLQFLEQLFATLRRAGLLNSQRGVGGGYSLARPAADITVLEVVQALDGRLGEEAREAGGIWREGVEALRGVFRETTIAEIAEREAGDAGAGMYYI
jgi:Rrf2 family transcriptional regulator, cysteine metabolism repressor